MGNCTIQMPLEKYEEMKKEINDLKLQVEVFAETVVPAKAYEVPDKPEYVVLECDDKCLV